MNQVFEIYLQNGPRDSDIRKINALLSHSKTVVEGLDLLQSIFKYCSVKFLNENLTSWLDVCLVKHPEHFTELKLSLIEKFIEASFINQELAKKISSEYLSKIIDLCLTSKGSYSEIELALDVLIICMKKYSTCNVHKTRIEAHILSFVDHSVDFIIEKAAVAFLYHQQLGNAGTKSINYIINFKTTVSKLCSSAQTLFDIFLENKEIEQNTPSSQESFQFDIHIDDNGNTTARSIKNIITFLRIFIQKGLDLYKEINPIEVLNLIKRGIVIHHCISEDSEQYSPTDIQFCIFDTSIQLDLLHLLRMLILWLRSSCLMYSFTIGKILIDSLKRCQRCSCFNFNCVYHETVYITLTCYINISKCSLTSYFQSELIKCIFNDIKPIKNEIALKRQPTNTKEHYLEGKKTMTAVLVNKEHQYDLHKSKHEIEKAELRCQLALDTLVALLNNSYLRVEKNIIHDILSLMMNIFNDIVTLRVPHPYKSSKSCLKLHQLLTVCCEQEALTNFPLISMTLNILQHSASSKLKNLSLKCQQSLNVLEKICQPISTPFPIFTAKLEYLNGNESGHKTEIVTQSLLEVVDDKYSETLVDSPTKINVIRNELIQAPNVCNNSSRNKNQLVHVDQTCKIISALKENTSTLPNVLDEDDNIEDEHMESDESFEPVLKKKKVQNKTNIKKINIEESMSVEPLEFESISFTDEVQDY